MPRFSLAEWQAEQARATAFPMTDVSAALQQWWRDVVRSEPDDVIVTSKKHSGSVQGTYGPGTLVLKTEPGRVDWLLVPAEAAVQESVPAGELPSLGAAVKTAET